MGCGKYWVEKAPTQPTELSYSRSHALRGNAVATRCVAKQIAARGCASRTIFQWLSNISPKVRDAYLHDLGILILS
jgi:hypothetical protein